MSLSRSQKALTEAANTVLSGADGRLVMDDLITVARGIADPHVRVGFQDAILHLQSRMSLARRDRLITESAPKAKPARIANLEERHG